MELLTDNVLCFEFTRGCHEESFKLFRAQVKLLREQSLGNILSCSTQLTNTPSPSRGRVTMPK